MSKAKLTITLIGILVVGSIVVYSVFYDKESNSTSITKDISQDAETTSSTEELEKIIRETFPETEEQKLEQIGFGKISNDKDWILAIDLPSVNQTLFIKRESWMEDIQEFDKELTQLETKQISDSAQRAQWQAILADQELSQAMIKIIQNEYAPVWNSRRESLIPINQKNSNIAEIIRNRYSSGAIPEPFNEIYKHTQDMALITDDLIGLAEINLLIKQETIQGISSRDLEKTIVAANDEDKTDLVYRWHEERFLELLERNDVIGTLIEGVLGNR